MFLNSNPNVFARTSSRKAVAKSIARKTGAAQAQAQQLFAAAQAAEQVAAFASQDEAEAFFRTTNGPVAFAQGMFTDAAMVAVFVGTFVARFTETGFSVNA